MSKSNHGDDEMYIGKDMPETLRFAPPFFFPCNLLAGYVIWTN